MYEILGKLLKDYFPLILYGLLISSAILIFSPVEYLEKLGVTELLDIYRSYLGILFLILLCISTVHVLGAFIPFARKHYRKHRSDRIVTRHLNELTMAEKAFLTPYIHSNENSILAELTCGIAGGLASKGIIYRASNLVENFAAPYNLHPFSRRYLNEHPELLNLE